MNEVLQANIFFVTASVSTVVFCVLVCVALFHLIKILAAVRAIVERIAAGSDALADDVEAMREFVKSGGLVSYLVSLVSPRPKTKKRTKPPHDE